MGLINASSCSTLNNLNRSNLANWNGAGSRVVNVLNDHTHCFTCQYRIVTEGDHKGLDADEATTIEVCPAVGSLRQFYAISCVINP